MEPSVPHRGELTNVVDVARSMLSGETGLIEGARLITSLRFRTDAPDDEAFDVIRSLESETDHLPVGTERALWSELALGEKDREIQEYVDALRVQVLEACKEIVKRFGP